MSSPTVLQIHLVSDILNLVGVSALTLSHRERYPLTSQIIEENKIPEFGMRHFPLTVD